MKRILLYLLFVGIPFSLLAEDSTRVEPIKADLSVTGFWQAGNVETWIFRAKSEVSVMPIMHWELKTRNSYVYQAFGGQKADEDILSLNFLTLKKHDKIQPLLLGFFSTNYRREISLRTLIGAGFTYEWIKNKKSSLKLSLTSEYEYTDFKKTDFNRVQYDGLSSINTFRATLWVNGRYNLFNSNMILTHESYIQPSLEQNNNYRWQADVGLEFPISSKVNFKVNYLQTYESIVIDGQKEEDRFLTFGLGVKNF